MESLNTGGFGTGSIIIAIISAALGAIVGTLSYFDIASPVLFVGVLPAFIAISLFSIGLTGLIAALCNSSPTRICYRLMSYEKMFGLSSVLLLILTVVAMSTGLSALNFLSAILTALIAAAFFTVSFSLFAFIKASIRNGYRYSEENYFND